MGFRNSHITVRRVGELTITFYDFETIFVQSTKTAQTLVYHKWYSPRGFYRECFSPFRRYLMASKQLEFYDIMTKARHHGVFVENAIRPPDLRDREVKLIDERGRNDKRNNKREC